jgi:23S rRNA pseudouridine2605 synthase
VRLNQYLARAGFGSRRACEELILEGAVTINGHRLRELATRVGADDNVLVHGKPVKMPLPLVAILHKPPGYLCTSPDATKERTIYDLLPTGWPRVVYVGRLDKDSEGLLVVTNDGNLAQRLTHPSTKMRKTYIVTLDREFDFALASKMKKGVSIEEGFARMEDIYRVGPRTLKVVLTQGLKRQIREMFFKIGYEVKRLVRIQIGQLSLDNLLVGQHRVLTQDDVKRYFPISGGPDNLLVRVAKGDRKRSAGHTMKHRFLRATRARATSSPGHQQKSPLKSQTKKEQSHV